MTCIIIGQLTVQLCVQETTHKGPGQYLWRHAIFSRWPILFASLLRNPDLSKDGYLNYTLLRKPPISQDEKKQSYSDFLSLWSIHFQMWRNPLPRLWPINVSSRTNGRWPILFVSLFSRKKTGHWPRNGHTLMHVSFLVFRFFVSCLLSISLLYTRISLLSSLFSLEFSLLCISIFNFLSLPSLRRLEMHACDHQQRVSQSVSSQSVSQLVSQSVS